MKPFDVKWSTIVRWLLGNSGSIMGNVIEPVEVYKVSLTTRDENGNIEGNKPSSILKRCEGARGILYMKGIQDEPLVDYSVLKRTRIIEVKDVSMKIRVHEAEIVNQLIYIENVLGFLKEVD